MRERRDEAPSPLVLAPGSGLEHVEASLEAMAYAGVVANSKVKERHVRTRSPVTAVEALAFRDVEGAAEDLAAGGVAGDDPGQPVAKPLDGALEKAPRQIE